MGLWNCEPEVSTVRMFQKKKKEYSCRCSSTDEWIKKLWFIYTMEYYSAIKRNELESVLVRWMNLKTVTQSEVSQKNTNIV